MGYPAPRTSTWLLGGPKPASGVGTTQELLKERLLPRLRGRKNPARQGPPKHDAASLRDFPVIPGPFADNWPSHTVSSTLIGRRAMGHGEDPTARVVWGSKSSTALPRPRCCCCASARDLPALCRVRPCLLRPLRAGRTLAGRACEASKKKLQVFPRLLRTAAAEVSGGTSKALRALLNCELRSCSAHVRSLCLHGKGLQNSSSST